MSAWPHEWLASTPGALCPRCGTRTGRPVLYGLPDPGVVAAHEAGDIDIAVPSPARFSEVLSAKYRSSIEVDRVGQVACDRAAVGGVGATGLEPICARGGQALGRARGSLRWPRVPARASGLRRNGRRRA